MARNGGQGRGSSRPGFRSSSLQSSPVNLRFVRGLFIAMAMLLSVCLCIGLPLMAQDGGGIDDVHITPRRDPIQPKPMDSVDPALKTHTRPYVKDVDLVLIPVTITDPMNRLVTGLDRQNFAVFEGKEKQEIRHFSSEDAPISLGVIFDMSGSMSDKIDRAKEAVVQFAETANPKDEFFLIGFSDKPELICGFTHHVEELRNKLVFTTAKGKTALLDAVYLGMDEMRHAQHRRKALLIISDGGDNNSRYTEGEIKGMVEEAEVQIYAVGLFDSSPRTPEEMEGPELLSEISQATGGRSFTVGNVNELGDVATKIGMELRNEYVLGYVPGKKPKDGKWHKIKVKLLPPKGLPPLNIYAKKGYYAPPQ